MLIPLNMKSEAGSNEYIHAGARLAHLPREWCRPHWAGLPMSVNTMKIFPIRRAQRLISQGTLTFVTLTTLS